MPATSKQAGRLATSLQSLALGSGGMAGVWVMAAKEHGWSHGFAATAKHTGLVLTALPLAAYYTFCAYDRCAHMWRDRFHLSLWSNAAAGCMTYMSLATLLHDASAAWEHVASDSIRQ